MPIRVIAIPSDVELVDFATKRPLTENGAPIKLSFESIISRLLSHPNWVESFAGMRSQQAVITAYQHAAEGEMSLAEEDWQRLRDAAEHPKVTNTNGDVVVGFGVHPAIAHQLVKLVQPIIDAKTR